MSSPATPTLQFFPGVYGFRGGIGRRHQADPFYGHAAGTQCTAIAPPACAYSLHIPPHQWTVEDMDIIMHF